VSLSQVSSLFLPLPLLRVGIADHPLSMFLADTKDLLLQSISVLLQYKEYIAIFETNATSQEKLMKILFESFDGRLWVQVASIISRFWKGVGFAENPAAPSSSSWLSSSEGDSSSPIFQHLFREFALKDPDSFSKYLNKLFNQLNWVATEFGVAVQAVRDCLYSPSNWKKRRKKRTEFITLCWPDQRISEQSPWRGE